MTDQKDGVIFAERGILNEDGRWYSSPWGTHYLMKVTTYRRYIVSSILFGAAGGLLLGMILWLP